MPNDSVLYWSKTTLPWMSFGYETQIPPIYTLTFFNAIANNGKMVRPMFTKEIINGGKVVKSFSTDVLKSSICSDETLEIIKGMLLGVVEQGTGKAVYSDAISIAGKTGTAQIASGGVYRTSGHQVAFCGYFPSDNPKYSCIVVIRRPRIGYPSGGGMSGVVVKHIAEKIYANYMSFDVKSLEKDSLAVLTPVPKNGNKEYLERVMSKLNIKMEGRNSETDWVVTDRTESGERVMLKDLTLIEGLVPHVTGMGAKDAVFLMESAGLRVSLQGSGRVVSQSIPPGQKASKNQTVLLTLR